MKKLSGLICAAALVCAACGQTDAGITTAVKTKMAADDTVKAYQVNVDTRNHVVTLSGKVNTSAAKERAIVLARETDGVRDVIDRLTVTETAATSGLLDRSGEPTIDVRVTGDDNGKGGNVIVTDTKKAAEATKDAAKKAGKATVHGAKKVGGKIQDAVTDKDRDSDRDGK
jgi:hypothetical protein